MAFLTVEYYEHIKDFLHPHIDDNIYHYRKGNVIKLPPYHGCNHVNRNGTRYNLLTTVEDNILTTVEDISAFVQLKSVIGEKQKINTT